MKTSERSRIRWSSEVSPPRLSSHQRLIVQLSVQLDGVELADRPEKGRLLMFAQVADSRNLIWQSHAQMDFDKVKEGVRSQYLNVVFSAFVLPGDYRVALGIVDTKTGEHGIHEERLRVAPLKNDPLPDAWSGLPPVEFLIPADAPDSWYLPSESAPLHLPVSARRSVQVDVLVNLTPSERATGSLGAQNNNLRVLLPALKAISQMKIQNGILNVAALDLVHQKVAFHQDRLDGLDWNALKAALSVNSAATIDLKSLEDRKRSAAFFVSEVARRFDATGEPQARVLIVLSSSVEFENGEDLHAIEAEPSTDRRIFYIRYQALVHRDRPEARIVPMGGHHGMGGGAGDWRRPGTNREVVQADQLEHTLKPLNPQLFDIAEPKDFRKALAAIVAEISRM